MRDTKVAEIVEEIRKLMDELDDDRHDVEEIRVRIAEIHDPRSGDADLFDIVRDRFGNLTVQPFGKRL